VLIKDLRDNLPHHNATICINVAVVELLTNANPEEVIDWKSGLVLWKVIDENSGSVLWKVLMMLTDLSSWRQSLL